MDIYSALDISHRRRIKADIPKLLRQIYANLNIDSVTVTTNALKLMELIFEDHFSEFLPELYLLFPRIMVYPNIS